MRSRTCSRLGSQRRLIAHPELTARIIAYTATLRSRHPPLAFMRVMLEDGPASTQGLFAPGPPPIAKHECISVCPPAEGADEATWEHQRRRGEDLAWLCKMVKDPERGQEAEEVETAKEFVPSEARRRLLEAIRRCGAT